MPTSVHDDTEFVRYSMTVLSLTATLCLPYVTIRQLTVASCPQTSALSVQTCGGHFSISHVTLVSTSLLESRRHLTQPSTVQTSPVRPVTLSELQVLLDTAFSDAFITRALVSRIYCVIQIKLNQLIYGSVPVVISLPIIRICK